VLVVILRRQRVCDCRYGFTTAAFAAIDAGCWSSSPRLTELIEYRIVEIVNEFLILEPGHGDQFSLSEGRATLYHTRDRGVLFLCFPLSRVVTRCET
jgi:hypothetical protein